MTKLELSIKLTWQRSSHVIAGSFSSSPTVGSHQFETFKRVSILEPVMKKKYINGLYNRKIKDLYNTKHTDKKENEIFLIYKEIQKRSVAKSYMMRKGYMEILKYLTLYEEAVSHI